MTINLFFSGLLVNFRSFPLLWELYSYISHMRYAWTAIMVNQFQDTDAMINGVHVMCRETLSESHFHWVSAHYPQ